MLDDVTHIIVSPEPEADGGHIEGVGDEVHDVPHVTEVPAGGMGDAMADEMKKFMKDRTKDGMTAGVKLEGSWYAPHSRSPMSQSCLISLHMRPATQARIMYLQQD